MGDGTGIEWTDATWNCVAGCSRVSEGCRHCYAEQQAARIVRMGKGKPTRYDGLVKIVGGEARWTGEVRLVPEALALPLRWRTPKRIVVNSMSDLFHEKLTNEQIAAVFGVMAAAPRHTFQILTKRAKRMREWFEWLMSDRHPAHDPASHAWSKVCLLCDAPGHAKAIAPLDAVWPLPNVWLGVSVENQDAADERIPELLATPAAMRFLSCEPLLGPVALTMKDESRRGQWFDYLAGPNSLDWIIAGCESGHGARRCDVAWLRSLRDQCAAAGVPFFLKQAEESTDCGEDRLLEAVDDDSIAFDEGSKMKARRPGGNHIIGLPYLDGKQHAEFPAAR